MTNTQSRNTAGNIAVSLTIVVVIALAIIAGLSIYAFNVTAQRDKYEAVTIPTLEQRNFELEKYERVYIQQAQIERYEQQVAEDRAMEVCEALVREQMSDVVTDPLGNPIDVTTFAQETCQDDLNTVGLRLFVEKFPSKG